MAAFADKNSCNSNVKLFYFENQIYDSNEKSKKSQSQNSSFAREFKNNTFLHLEMQKV